MFNNFDPQGNPTAPIVNQLVNFGWQYVYHCHILSHEEMDMMRPVSVALPPWAPINLAFTDNLDGTGTLTWTDNSLSETAFVVQWYDGTGWVGLGTDLSPLDVPNTSGGTRILTFAFDPLVSNTYRVVAQNTVGYGFEFPTKTVQSVSAELVVNVTTPAAPTNLTATLLPGLQVSLAWTDNATNETGFEIERSTGGVNFSLLATTGANVTSLVDSPVVPGTTYTYQVRAVNVSGPSVYSNQASVIVPLPPDAPVLLTAAPISSAQVNLTWSDVATEDGYVIERSADLGLNWSQVGQTTANITAFSDLSVLPFTTYQYRVYAFNLGGNSLPSNVLEVATPDGPPVAPSNLSATNVTQTSLTLNWQDNSNNELGFTVEMASDIGFTNILQTVTTSANAVSQGFSGLIPSTTYYFRVNAFNGVGTSAWSAPLVAATSPATIPLPPTNLTTSNVTQTSITLNWVDNSNNESGFTVQIATNNGFTQNLQTFTTGPNATSYVFTGLTPGTKYYFRVASFNAAGQSLWAPAINDKTLR